MLRVLAMLLLAFWANIAQGACTLIDQDISFGTVAFSSPAGTIQVPITLTINCTVGQAYTLEPNANTTYGYIGISLTGGGNAGTQYVYFQKDGQIMRRALTSSLITGTGTGANQIYNVVAVMSASSLGALTALTKAGTASLSNRLWLINAATTGVSAHAITANVVASCTISSANLDFGTISPGSTAATTYSPLDVTCDAGIAYQLAPDSGAGAARWVLLSGFGLDVTAGDLVVLRVNVKDPGGSTYNTWKPTQPRNSLGTGVNQSFNMQGVLSIPSGYLGSFSTTLAPQATF